MGLFSALFGSKALLKANSAAQKTTEEGKKEALGFYQPYAAAGTNALKYFQDGSGVGDSNAAIENFQNSPEYKLNYDAAIKAGGEGVRNQFQAGGMSNSGSTLKALQDRAQQTSNDFYGNYMRRLGGLSDNGLQTAGAMGNTVTGAGQQIADQQQQRGQIKAAKWGAIDGILGGGLKLLGGVATGGLSNAIGSGMSALSAFRAPVSNSNRLY